MKKTFKERFNNHIATVRNKSKRKSKELFKQIWELNLGNNIQKQVSWDMASRTCPYYGGTWKYDLCVTEKLMLANADHSSLLNTCNDFISKCRHLNKFTVKCLKISQ